MGTLVNMRLDLLSMLGERNDSNWASSRLDRFLNRAQRRVAEEHDFSSLKEELTSISTVIDQAFIDLPTTTEEGSTVPSTREIYSIALQDDTSSVKLAGLSRTAFDSMVARPEAHGTARPHSYSVWNNRVDLWRVPDAVYNLHIRRSKWPDYMTNEGPPTEMLGLDEIIVLAAAVQINVSLEKRENANWLFTIYKNRLKDAIAADQREPDTVHVPFRGPDRSANYWQDPFSHFTGAEGDW